MSPGLHGIIVGGLQGLGGNIATVDHLTDGETYVLGPCPQLGVSLQTVQVIGLLQKLFIAVRSKYMYTYSFMLPVQCALHYVQG